MSFTFDQNLEQPTEGQSDWDTSLRANASIVERGRTAKLQTGELVGSGQIVQLLSTGLIVPHNAASASIGRPFGMAYAEVLSGDQGFFVTQGIVRSLTIWSGGLTIGQPVFADPLSLGFAVNCYDGARHPVGTAIAVDGVMVQPSQIFPDYVSEVQCGGALAGASFNFDMSLGRRGVVRKLHVLAVSCDAFQVLFHSNSTRVASDLIYQTATTSAGTAIEFDVSTIDYLDAALFPYRNTNPASPALIYGRITVQSASSVGSEDAFRVELQGDRVD
jgi:hypothetical protein